MRLLVTFVIVAIYALMVYGFYTSINDEEGREFVTIYCLEGKNVTKEVTNINNVSRLEFTFCFDNKETVIKDEFKRLVAEVSAEHVYQLQLESVEPLSTRTVERAAQKKANEYIKSYSEYRGVVIFVQAKQ